MEDIVPRLSDGRVPAIVLEAAFLSQTNEAFYIVERVVCPAVLCERSEELAGLRLMELSDTFEKSKHIFHIQVLAVEILC